MANWLRLPSGRLCNLDLFADIDSDIANDRPWARATLAAGASVGPDYDAECQAVTISYGGADARALIRHFVTQEIVRDAPLAGSAGHLPGEPAPPPREPLSCHTCGASDTHLYHLALANGPVVRICPRCEDERVARQEREMAARADLHRLDDVPF